MEKKEGLEQMDLLLEVWALSYHEQSNELMVANHIGFEIHRMSQILHHNDFADPLHIE